MLFLHFVLGLLPPKTGHKLSYLVPIFQPGMRALLISEQQADIQLFTYFNNNPEVTIDTVLALPGSPIRESMVAYKGDVVIVSNHLLDDSVNDLKRLTVEFARLAFVVLCDEAFSGNTISFIRDGAHDYLYRFHFDELDLMKCLQLTQLRGNLKSELIKARSEAEEARDHNNRMLSRMSQEIRAPMNAITGMAEMLRDTELNSRQKYYLQVIQESGSLLVGSINDLLDFARIEAGKVKIMHKPFRIIDTIRESIDSARPAAIEKKIDLSYHIDSCLPSTLIGDDLRLRQIMMNLIDNAIKFTGHGYVLVRARCNFTNGVPFLALSVEDSGQGIPEELIPELFKAYAKADEGGRIPRKGLGLGLAICRRLVNLMNGDISVKSVIDEGTVFMVNIPMEDCRLLNDETSISEQIKGRKVLYMTSVKIQDELFTDYFSYWGMDLHIRYATEDYPEMSNVLDDYDLLISQLRPNFKLDLKLIDRVRNFKQMPHILIKNPETAQDQMIVIRKDTVILPKPIDVHEMYEVIVSVLSDNAAALNNVGGMLNLNEHMGESHPLDILVAEDNAINQKIIQSVLNRYGYHPKMVENGAQALAAISNRIYDVVLMDIQMPEMDGIEACREIRSTVEGNRMPAVIALTADALQQSHDEYLSHGFDDVLYKPVQTKAMMMKLAKCTRIKRF